MPPGQQKSFQPTDGTSFLLSAKMDGLSSVEYASGMSTGIAAAIADKDRW